MQGTRAICVALLAVAELGAGCSGKKSEPPPSTEAPRAPIAQATTSEDAGAPIDATTPAPATSAAAAVPSDVVADPGDPLAARFPKHYTDDSILSDQIEIRIRYHLRSQTKAPTAINRIIRVPQANGGLDVFAIYEYSLFEDCMLRYPNRKEGRAKCLPDEITISERDPANMTEEEKVRLNEKCVVLGVVRAHFDPPEPGIPEDAGGKATVRAAKLAGTLCAAHEYDHFFVADLDGDEKLELLIDITTSAQKLASEPWVRDRPARTIVGEQFQRNLYVFTGETDGFALSAKLAEWEGDFPVPPPQELVELRDVNRDRRLDIVLKQFCYETPFIDKAGAEHCGLRGVRPETAVYVYDSQSDAWSRKGAAKAPAKAPAPGAPKESAKAPAPAASAPL